MTSKPAPDHGTRARYLRGCHCPACNQAHYRYMGRYRLDRARGTARRVEAEPARLHAQRLYDAGWTTGQIAEAAGCVPTCISRILRGQYPNVHADLAARILAAQPSLSSCSPTTFVPAIGTIRRVQALMVIGHSLGSIATAAGMHRDPLGAILNGRRPTVRIATAKAIGGAYTRLSRTAGTSVRARLRAQANGWAGPIAWDDNIDDPDAQADLTGVTQRRRAKKRSEAADLIAEVRHLALLGESVHAIAKQLGRSETRIAELMPQRFGEAA